MKNEKPLLICIIGVDGVGKTTHAKQILLALTNKGIRSEYRWFRFFHFFSIFLLSYSRLTGLTTYEKKNGQKIGRHNFYKSKTVSFLYPWVLFIDMFFIYLVRIFLPLRLGTTLVCDRFIHDTIVDLMVDLRDYDIQKKYVGKLFTKLIPKNSKIILLHLDQETIKKRRKDLINDQSLIDRQKAYFLLAKYFNIPIVDNNDNISDVHQNILTILDLNNKRKFI